MVNGTVGVCSAALAVAANGAVQTGGGLATVTFSQAAVTAIPVSVSLPNDSNASGLASYFSSYGGAGSGGPALTGAAPSAVATSSGAAATTTS